MLDLIITNHDFKESYSMANYPEDVFMYSWPLNNMGVRGAKSLHSQISMYNFWLPKNLSP